MIFTLNMVGQSSPYNHCFDATGNEEDYKKLDPRYEITCNSIALAVRNNEYNIQHFYKMLVSNKQQNRIEKARSK